MSDETDIELPEEVAQKPLISLPFIIVVGVLAVGGYFAGPHIMAYVFLQQEAAKADFVEKPEEFADLSEMAKQMMANPGAGMPAAEIDTGAGGGGGGRGFDPEARFAEMDADGDGKIAGDEIQGRLVERIGDIDSDEDGAITKEEFMAALKGRGGRSRPAASVDTNDDSSDEKSDN